MIASFSVRPGVYFAAVQGEGVIMDLVEDRYYGLGAASAAIWRALQTGQPPERIAEALAAGTPTEVLPHDTDVIARQLEAWAQAKLITTDSHVPADLPELKPVGTPAAIGLDARRVAAATFSAGALLRLLRAAWWSRRALHRRGICWTLKRIQQVSVPRAEPRGRLDDALHRTMRVYYSSRRLSLQGKDDCLPRALTLAMALRTLGVDAQVCFGVQKFPFAAHAWVEAGERVINDSPSNVRKYTLVARF